MVKDNFDSSLVQEEKIFWTIPKLAWFSQAVQRNVQNTMLTSLENFNEDFAPLHSQQYMILTFYNITLRLLSEGW